MNSDAVAYATLQFAMTTEIVSGAEGKGNLQLPELLAAERVRGSDDDRWPGPRARPSCRS